MPDKEGCKLNYTEARNPRVEGDGKYCYHPKFISGHSEEPQDFNDRIRESQWANLPHLEASLLALHQELVDDILDSRAVRIGDMFIARPRIRLKKHKDEHGRYYTNKYYEGEKIPADDIVFDGLEVRATKALEKEIARRVSGFSRFKTKAHRQKYDDEVLLQEIKEYCDENGLITIKAFCANFGFSDFMARKILNGYCLDGHSGLVKEKEGNVWIYRTKDK